MNYYESDDSDSEEEPVFVPVVKPRRRRAGAGPSSASAHQEEVFAFKCVKCDAGFHSEKELKAHKVNAKDHDYCLKCNRDFESWDKHQAHLIISPMHIICCHCYKEFKSDGGLEGHMKQMHRNTVSAVCPGCESEFSSVSGVIQHIENDLCKGGLRRHQLQRHIVKASDPYGIETNTSSTHYWRPGIGLLNIEETKKQMPDIVEPLVSVLDYVDVETKSDSTMVTEQELERCWNAEAKAYICYYRGCNKRYAVSGVNNPAHSMIQHLRSPVHGAKRFRCPTCLDRFKSASALQQHCESQSCHMHATDHASVVTKTLTGGLLSQVEGWDLN